MSQAEQNKSHGSTAVNRLIKETSPYLLQHAYNPVDWHPWGPEALQKAQSEDKPILLSIGYAACHWCHVMEHESFEDESTAALMNKEFVNIKVDREERPDLDEIYMKAVQMMTGHGGWPMTVFLTPDLKPFFGGTYFPPTDRQGMPAFSRVLAGVSQAWKQQREQLEQSSQELTQYLQAFDKIGHLDTTLDRLLIDEAVSRILQYCDSQWGGLGNAPKFPHCSALELMMRYAAPGSPVEEAIRTECRTAVHTWLDKMAYGGMQDQIGGGFARYSVDRQWLIPHFEKMLYDNALLAQAYLNGFTLTGRNYWARVAQGTLEFVLRELTTTDGAFYSSLDADSEGQEGKFYAWTPEQILETLGQESSRWLSPIYGVTPAGNFEGMSVLHLTDSPENLAQGCGISLPEFWTKLEVLNQKLLAERQKRVRPGRDEKVLTSWNGLMISALARGYAILKQDRYLKAAQAAANFVLKNLYSDGRLWRTWGKGQAKLNSYLDDYAFVINALLDLAEVDTDSRWFNTACKLMDKVLNHFWDADDGGFFYTSDDHEKLVTRPKNYFDGSIPSGTSVITDCLLKLAALTGQQNYMDKAEAVMKLYAPHIGKMPDQFSNLLCAMDRYLSPSTEIALVANMDKTDWPDMLWAIHGTYLPHKVMLVEAANRKDNQRLDSPLLSNRGLVNQQTTTYICQNYTCRQPLTNPKEVSAQLHNLRTQTFS